jgi:hypothetical protein
MPGIDGKCPPNPQFDPAAAEDRRQGQRRQACEYLFVSRGILVKDNSQHQHQQRLNKGQQLQHGQRRHVGRVEVGGKPLNFELLRCVYWQWQLQPGGRRV